MEYDAIIELDRGLRREATLAPGEGEDMDAADEGVAGVVLRLRQAEHDLRQSETRYQLALEGARLGTWQCDVNRQRWLWNERMYELFQLDPTTSTPASAFWQRVHPDDRRRHSQAMDQVAAGVWLDSEHRILLDDGSIRWVRHRGQLQEGDPPQGRRIVGVCADTTACRQAERDLQELNETLEQQVAQRTAVAEQHARDLRRLAAELSHAEQRERKRLAAVLHDHLQQLLVAARLRLPDTQNVRDEQLRQDVATVGQLLAECIGASRSLTMELSPPILDYGTLAEILDWLGGWFGATQGLKVTVSTSRGIPPVSEHLRVFLFQAVRELLRNVVKHAGAAEAVVHLSHAAGSLTVLVEDAGQGFDPEDVAARRDGQGFGLFSIRERLRALEGQLEIRRLAGGGASLRLTIPLESSMERATEVGPVSAATPSPRRPRMGRAEEIRLLVADDHKIVREGLVRLLDRQPGFKVVGEAMNGEKAIRQADDLQPDVIIMDVDMPILDGLEATRRITAAHPAIAVVGLSFHREEEKASAMLAAGARAYLQKDEPSEKLFNTIRRVCPP